MKSYNYESFCKETTDDNSIVMFYIKLNGANQLVKPISVLVAKEYNDELKFYAVVIDNPDEVYLKKLKIHFFPTYIFIKGGQIHSLLSGTFSLEELTKKVKEFVEEELR